jgi:uncharacterized protein
MRTAKKIRLSVRMWIRRMVRSNATPEQIARGMSAGLLAAWFPLPGLQTILAILMAISVRGNYIAAAAGTWLTNPVTSLPCALSAWALAHYLLLSLGLPHSDVDMATVKEAVSSFSEASVREGLSQVSKLGLGLYAELWIGSILLGIGSAAAGYYITLRLAVAEHRMVEQIRARRAKREEQESDPPGIANGDASTRSEASPSESARPAPSSNSKDTV